jgi:hypothetical protein
MASKFLPFVDGEVSAAFAFFFFASASRLSADLRAFEARLLRFSLVFGYA